MSDFVALNIGNMILPRYDACGPSVPYKGSRSNIHTCKLEWAETVHVALLRAGATRILPDPHR